MANYNSLEQLLASTVNLVQLVKNTAYDDSTLTIDGVDWFKFNNVVATKIYINGNSWFGFGGSSEQLKVCRRDAKMYNFWREEGTLFNHFRFLRMKWDGFSRYNSTSSDVALCYEVFLFDTGDIFLNVIQAPTNTSYLGTSQLVCSGGTKSFAITAGATVQVTFTSLNEAGSDYEMTYGLIPIEPPYNRKFLVSDIDGRIYTIDINNEEQTLVEIENVTDLTAELFQTYGIDDLPVESLLMNLISPGILFWQDSENELPTIQMGVTALPPNQTVYTENVSMADSTIKGIENVTIDSDDLTLFAVSVDGGISWYAYVDSIWSQLSETQSGMTRLTVEGIGTDAWALFATTGQMKFRFNLAEGSYVNNITIHYLN
ncbi:hypothetical protein [Oceanobacillus massiliensis]|uniref:hypothetical protein n=1 Tax=Oceanobacillus massiliensis TaxID=1465765 RepID=UPI00028A2560|nr:hypothetical protein [Oceanobacillus massiliensis]